ncbi:hypothetical protein [Aquimarina latercula]|uniref:hypothetical protein n=1 Tax=Aquimarina latercula TaxID=987 RepID=UPI00041C1DBC|nr:hypothetical protein [Aquimarina latercula]
MGTNTFKLQVAGITKTASVEVVEDILFSVQFERKRDYKGEFGFDWMRDNYQTVSQNYEELKKEYKETKINNQEYFVPYLSMFPNQEGVILNLKLDILEGKARKDDVIKLPTIDGIKFDPDEVSIKDLVKEQKALEKEKAKGFDGDVSSIDRTEIKVICENALSQDVSIELLDKNDSPVGEIIVVKNDEVFDVDVKFVIVNSDETRSLNYLKKKFNRSISDIETHLENNSLNQALIKPNIIEKEFDNLEFINLNDLPDEMFNSNRTKINSKGRDELKERCNLGDNFKGLVVFYLGVEHVDSKAGDAQSLPLNDQFVYLYLSSALETDLSHEIGHALGLQHTFVESSDYVTRMNNSKQFYQDQLDKNSGYLNDSRYNQTQVSDNIEKLNNRMTKIDNNIRDYKKVEENNRFKFEQSKTTNLMDYENNHKDFFHWQWKIMQKEVIKYYN